jgi:hypothetical protein
MWRALCAALLPIRFEHIRETLAEVIEYLVRHDPIATVNVPPNGVCADGTTTPEVPQREWLNANASSSPPSSGRAAALGSIPTSSGASTVP